jgi:addiction module HigA family antidote
MTELPELPVNRPTERAPTHPGELFAEILEDHVKLSVAEAAVRMGITRQALYDVLGQKAAVSAPMALRFGKLVGGDPELYLAMQAHRDLWLAQQKLRPDLDAISPVR